MAVMSTILVCQLWYGELLKDLAEATVLVVDSDTALVLNSNNKEAKGS